MIKKQIFLSCINFINTHMTYVIVLLLGMVLGAFINNVMTPTEINLVQSGVYSSSTNVNMENDTIVIRIKNVQTN